jgi:hypothetical protein
MGPYENYILDLILRHGRLKALHTIFKMQHRKLFGDNIEETVWEKFIHFCFGFSQHPT